MTILIGILCQDGVVVGTDSSATFGSSIPTIEQPVDKIEILKDKIIIAGTGSVGLNQRFCKIAEEFFKAPQSQSLNHQAVVNELCKRTINDFRGTGYDFHGNPRHPLNWNYGALIAFPNQSDFYLCELPATNFQPEFRTKSIWFSSMGSGQSIADPFLGFIRSVFCKDGSLPRCEEGKFYASLALAHTIEVNPGGINGPINMAILQKDGGAYKAKILTRDELAEHENNVADFMGHVKKYKDIFNSPPTAPQPTPP